MDTTPRSAIAEARAAALEEEADRIDRMDLPQDYVDVFDSGARWATSARCSHRPGHPDTEGTRR